MSDDQKLRPTPKGVDLRVVVVACSAWLGTLLGLRLGPIESPVLGSRVSVMFAIATVVAFVISKGILGLDVALLIGASVVAAWISVLVAGSTASMFEGDPIQNVAAEQAYVRALVVVIGQPGPASSSWSTDTLVVELRTRAVCTSNVEDGSTECGVPSSVRLWGEVSGGASLVDALIPGSTLLVGGISSKEDWLSPPIAARFKVTSYSVVEGAPRSQLWAASLRRSMREATTATGVAGPLISGMAIGDDALMSAELRESMLISSLTHLTAVSGSHIAISLALVSRILRGRRRLQATAVCSFLVLVIIVVGPEPSVVRSVSMSGLAVWGTVRRRPSQPLGLLAVVALASVLIDPWLAISIGFALSVSATAAIIVVAGPLERALVQSLPEEGVTNKMGSLVAGTVSVAVSASSATVPILALLNPWLPLWGIVANLLVAPVVAPLTLLGLGAALASLFAPNLAGFLVKCAEPFADWLVIVATRTATLPLAKLPWPQGIGGLFLSVAVTIVAWGAVIALYRRLTNRTA
ncbi:ComEC/Rec2 family competence protein [Actinomycetaceae bacterium MB13-C1-2]|nr:ComEC/Rec2 family competence protein [Actinomycetaceae bacterium MB13-C1-2]